MPFFSFVLVLSEAVLVIVIVSEISTYDYEHVYDSFIRDEFPEAKLMPFRNVVRAGSPRPPGKRPHFPAYRPLTPEESPDRILWVEPTYYPPPPWMGATAKITALHTEWEVIWSRRSLFQRYWRPQKIPATSAARMRMRFREKI